MIDAGLGKYNLKRDGTGDNVEGFKLLAVDAINSGEGIHLPPGHYRTSAFQLGSGVTFVGENRSSTTISAHPSLPISQPLLSLYYSSDALIENICFTAENLPKGRTEALVASFWGLRNTFKACSFLMSQGSALSLAFGVDAFAKDCFFSGTGPVNGMGIWVGSTADSPARNTTIEGCLFSALQGCSLVDTGQGTSFLSNEIRNQTETALYCLPSARDFKYKNNKILSVHGSPPPTDGSYDGASAGGMEIGGWDGEIEGNTIRGTQNGGIDIQSSGRISIRNNNISLVGLPRDPRWPIPAAISYLSMKPDASESLPGGVLPRPFEISIRENQLDGGEFATIRFWRQEGGPKVDSVFIFDNLGLKEVDGLLLDEGTKGLDFFVARNLIHRVF